MPWPPSSEQKAAVRQHLETAFPGFDVEVQYEDTHMLHRFRLVQNSEPKHELQLSGRSIFEDGDDIVGILVRDGVVGRVRQAGPTPVRVSKYGQDIVIQ